MTPPVAAADTCFHFFVWGCILMITVPWWPFLHPGPAGRCVIMVTLELMVLVRPSSPDSFSPPPPVSPWSLLTMLSGVISHHQCAQYLGVHFAHYYSDKYYFIALIPPAVTNIVLGSRKHALLGSLILSENNWNADCFSDPSGEWLLAWVLTVTWIFSCDQSRPHGASQGRCLVTGGQHEPDLWLARHTQYWPLIGPGPGCGQCPSASLRDKMDCWQQNRSHRLGLVWVKTMSNHSDDQSLVVDVLHKPLRQAMDEFMLIICFAAFSPSWHSNLYLFMRSALWSILLSPVMQMLHPVWNYNVGQNICVLML